MLPVCMRIQHHESGDWGYICCMIPKGSPCLDMHRLTCVVQIADVA